MSVLNSLIEEDFKKNHAAAKVIIEPREPVRIEVPMVEDEIPGYSTYLYGRNRFRKPEETVNFWKREEKADELAKRLGIEKLETAELVELIAEMERRITGLQEQVSAEVRKTDELMADVRRLGSAKADAENARISAEERERKAVIAQKQAEGQCKKRHDEVVKYGDHVVGCAYLEATYSGRRLSPNAEGDLCDCDWVEIRKEL